MSWEDWFLILDGDAETWVRGRGSATEESPPPSQDADRTPRGEPLAPLPEWLKEVS